MKKYIMFVAVAAFAGMIMGCSSVPKHVNMTGTWKYTFTEKGKEEVQTGSMQLSQAGFDLSGKANDAYGEFAVTGKVNSPNVSLKGTRNDGKRTFMIDANLECADEFEGTYTTDQQTSGTINAKRN